MNDTRFAGLTVNRYRFIFLIFSSFLVRHDYVFGFLVCSVGRFREMPFRFFFSGALGIETKRREWETNKLRIYGEKETCIK